MPSPKQLAAHAFQKGGPPGPGRPKGSRTRLQEFVIAMFTEDFREHGQEVIARVRQQYPQVYLRAAVDMLPKQTQKIESPFHDLTDEQLDQLEAFLRASRAHPVTEIEPRKAEPASPRALIPEPLDKP